LKKKKSPNKEKKKKKDENFLKKYLTNRFVVKLDDKESEKNLFV